MIATYPSTLEVGGLWFRHRRLRDCPAPQPDHDVHDGAPYSRFTVHHGPAPRGCLAGHNATGLANRLARPRDPLNGRGGYCPFCAISNVRKFISFRSAYRTAQRDHALRP